MDRWFPRAGETGENKGVTTNGYRISFRGDEKVLELDSSDGCKTL